MSLNDTNFSREGQQSPGAPRPTRTLVLEVRPANAHRTPVQDRGTPPPTMSPGTQILDSPVHLDAKSGREAEAGRGNLGH